MSKRKRRVFTAEQKSEAVKLVKELGNLSQVARNLDLHPNVLRNWVKQAEKPTLVLPIQHLPVHQHSN